MSNTEPANPTGLRLDPDNPRLAAEDRGSSEERLIEILLNKFNLQELAESIITSGYVELDPLVCVREDSSLVVLEGNRRLATLKLLLDPSQAPEKYQETWNAYQQRLSAESLQAIKNISVVVFSDRNDPAVRSYIGFRHVTGILPWRPFEKAAYISMLALEQGWSYSEIAERLGSYPKHVERHFIAYRLVCQAQEHNFPGFDQMADSFGVLVRALQASGVEDYLGINYPGDPTHSLEPIPRDKLEDLQSFVRWTFGTEDQEAILTDSRQLTRWGRILQSDDAVKYLKGLSLCIR